MPAVPLPTAVAGSSKALAVAIGDSAHTPARCGRGVRERVAMSGLKSGKGPSVPHFPPFESLGENGVDEIACLIDFGIGSEDVMSSLRRLSML